MTKNLIAALAVIAVTAAIWGAESWLDAHRFDRASAALLLLVAGSIVVLMAVLILHFGRFA